MPDHDQLIQDDLVRCATLVLFCFRLELIKRLDVCVWCIMSVRLRTLLMGASLRGNEFCGSGLIWVPLGCRLAPGTPHLIARRGIVLKTAQENPNASSDEPYNVKII